MSEGRIPKDTGYWICLKCFKSDNFSFFHLSKEEAEAYIANDPPHLRKP